MFPSIWADEDMVTSQHLINILILKQPRSNFEMNPYGQIYKIGLTMPASVWIVSSHYIQSFIKRAQLLESVAPRQSQYKMSVKFMFL